jgi:predicted nucleic acid-binding protein
MFLLDTNVVSELRKVESGRADPRVVAWAASVPAAAMYLSALSVFELERGVLRMERSDRATGQVLRAWLDTRVLPAFHGRILPVTDDVARRAAAFHVPDLAPYTDALIGATADAHGLTVVTRNRADFERLAGVRVLDPWS